LHRGPERAVRRSPVSTVSADWMLLGKGTCSAGQARPAQPSVHREAAGSAPFESFSLLAGAAWQRRAACRTREIRVNGFVQASRRPAGKRERSSEDSSRSLNSRSSPRFRCYPPSKPMYQHVITDSSLAQSRSSVTVARSLSGGRTHHESCRKASPAHLPSPPRTLPFSRFSHSQEQVLRCDPGRSRVRESPPLTWPNKQLI